ncbi:MAG: hypothetical protein JW884_04685 [Deltaproteobacteria bacterium]|nr:hypothetical protein [Deltaproteobacteria bacterium]
MKKRSIFLMTVAAILSAAACGYRTTPGTGMAPAEVRILYVDRFVNTTDQPYLENYLKNAFVDQIVSGRRFSLAPNGASADALLSGKVLSLRSAHASLDGANVAQEDRLYLSVEVSLRKRSDGSLLWSLGELAENRTYRIHRDDYRSTGLNRDQALKLLARDLAEKAYRNLMTGF